MKKIKTQQTMKIEQRKIERSEGEQPESAIERRFFKSEVRAKRNEGGKMEISGRGALFNSYTYMNWYAEVIKEGFFDGIKDDRSAVLFNHDVNQILGRKRNGTLSWGVDAEGAFYSATLPESRADVFDLIDGGYVYESSFGFSISESKWEEVDRSALIGKLPERDLDALTYGGKVTVRYLVKGDELYDFSPVTYAAYEGTTVDTKMAKRSFDAWKGELEKQEMEIRQMANEAKDIETQIEVALMERQFSEHLFKTR